MFDGLDDGGRGTSNGHVTASTRPVLIPDNAAANVTKKAGFRYLKICFISQKIIIILTLSNKSTLQIFYYYAHGFFRSSSSLKIH